MAQRRTRFSFHRFSRRFALTCSGKNSSSTSPTCVSARKTAGRGTTWRNPCAAFAPAVGVSPSAQDNIARYPANCDSAHQKDQVVSQLRQVRQQSRCSCVLSVFVAFQHLFNQIDCARAAIASSSPRTDPFRGRLIKIRSEHRRAGCCRLQAHALFRISPVNWVCIACFLQSSAYMRPGLNTRKGRAAV